MILNNSGKDFVLTSNPLIHGLDMIGGITSLLLELVNVEGVVVVVVVLVSSILFVSIDGSVTVKFSGMDSEINDDEDEEGELSSVVSNVSGDSDIVIVSLETFCAGDRSPERFVVDSCGISSRIDSLRFKTD